MSGSWFGSPHRSSDATQMTTLWLVWSTFSSPTPFPVFLQTSLQHREVPRLVPGLELQQQAMATATLDPSRLCDPCRSVRQRQILNPLSRDGTRILTDTTLGS